MCQYFMHYEFNCVCINILGGGESGLDGLSVSELLSSVANDGGKNMKSIHMCIASVI